MPLRGGVGGGATAASAITMGGDVTGTAAASVVSGISGVSPIIVTPAVLEFAAATVTPSITQATLTAGAAPVAGQAMAVAAQTGQASTGAAAGGSGAAVSLSAGTGGTSVSGPGGAGGNATVSAGAGVGSGSSAGTGGSLTLSAGSTSGNTAPGNVTIQAGTSGGAVPLGLIKLAGLVGGRGTAPFGFAGQTSPNTVVCGTGGTQTVSAAQAILPFFLVTTGTLSSNAIVDFGTNAVTGFFIVDLSGVGTLGAFTLGFKNGTTTKTISATQLTNLIATGASAAMIATYGTNNITILT